MLSQVRKLEADILPLQESNAELSEKSGMLQAEKKLLEEDVKRWKARTQVGKCLLSKNIMWRKGSPVRQLIKVLDFLTKNKKLRNMFEL